MNLERQSVFLIKRLKADFSFMLYCLFLVYKPETPHMSGVNRTENFYVSSVKKVKKKNTSLGNFFNLFLHNIKRLYRYWAAGF